MNIIEPIVVLDDTKPYDYTLGDRENTNVTYMRNFANTQWQALYVPFAMKYANWQADFEVAYINDTHQFDDNNDGILDRTLLEVVIMPEGSMTEANKPYLIRAKVAGQKILKVTKATVKAKAVGSIDCSSTKVNYVFRGTYDGVKGQDMYANRYYALVDGQLLQAESQDAGALGGYRWYLTAQDRTGAPAMMTSAISLRVIRDGQIVEDGTTDVMEVKGEQAMWPADIYDLNGRVVRKAATNAEGLPHGVYVVRGKKMVW